MATIDEKVVAMNFESSKFEAGAGRVLAALGALKKALNLDGAAKGLTGIDTAAKNVKLDHIGKAVDDVRNKFSALSVAALAVFASIAVKAVQTGAAVVKSFTLDPILQGFQEYETQINAVQTILSNTAAAGTNLEDVTQALDELNEYADLTIYNFAEMAKNIGTFTAAGVDLETSVSSIKGIANLAALSGSNASQAATAMYQLSQAISSGTVRLMDWVSVRNAGMGGAVFQKALVQTAVNMGTVNKNAVELVGPMKTIRVNGEAFAQSLATGPGEGWLTSEVLTNTLSQLAGEFTNAELKAQGFSDAQVKAIQAQAKMATEAATKVKTLSQLLSTTKEQVASGWAQTFKILLGDFGEAKRLFTGISDAIGGFVGKSADARNSVLQDWKDLGGRTLLIASLKSAFQSLGDVLGSIGDAFRDIFPARTGKDLLSLTKRFSEFVKTLKPSAETLDNLRRTFRGIFAVLDIGKEIVSGVFSVIGRLFGAVAGGSGGFLSLTAAIGDFLVKVRDTLKESGAITGFFSILGSLAAGAVEVISDLAGAIASLFPKNSPGGLSGPLGGLSDAMGPLSSAADSLAESWDNFLDGLSGTDGVVANASAAISAFFGSLGTFIAESFSSINWDSVIAVINTGLFAALVLAFKKFFGKGSLISQIAGGGGGFLSSITGIFDGVTGSLKAMQQSLQAKAIRDIAIAIGILALSLLVLSTIPEDKMGTALGGLITTFGVLIGAMAILNKIALGPGVIKLPIIAASFILLSIAIGLLAVSLKALSTLDWEELAKGLTGVTGILAALAASAKFLSKGSLGLAAASVGIIGIAIAMKILASAVKDFGNLSWEQLGKGMAAIAGALVAIGGAARLFPANMVFIGAGLIAVGVALKIIAGAISSLATLSWEEISKGLVAIAGALVGIGVATKLMGPSLLLVGPGLIAVAVAMTIIGKAIAQMGSMSVEEIAKGLITLGGALGILAAGLYLMSGTLAGAAALVVAAVGIRILAGALAKMGGQSWGEIIKGMVGLAGAIGLLAGASLLLGGAVPAMLAMGAALLLIGGGLALAGAGIFLIGLGLAAIATSGTAAIAVLVGGLDMLMERLPKYVEDMTQAFIAMALSIAKAAPEFIESIGLILVALSQAIIKAAPQLTKAAVVLISNLLTGLKALGPQIVATGMSLLLDLLRGIRNNIPQIVTLVADIIAAFILSLSQNMGKINAAGVTLVVNFLLGISNNLNRIIAAGVTIVTRFVTGIGNGASRIVRAATQTVVKFITAIGQAGPRIITAGTRAIVNFITGVGNAGPRIVTAAVTAMTKFINAVAKNAVKMADEGAKAVILFLNGVADVIEKREPEMIGAGARIGKAIIMGLIQGLVNFAQQAYDKAREIMENLKNILKKPFDIFSPSRVMADVGKNIILGLVNGLDGTAPKAFKSAEVMSNGVIDAVKSVFQITSPSKVMKELGKFIGDGFLEGLQGSQQSIRNAVLTLNRMLSDSVLQAKQEIVKQKQQIAKLRAEEKPDTKAIEAAQKTIERNERLIRLASAANKELMKDLTGQRAKLSKLAKDYGKLSAEMDVALDKLKEAQKLRDDAASGYSDQYSDLPSMLRDEDAVNPDDVLGNYKKNLENQGAAVEKFSTTLAQLRSIGLSDALYKELVDTGVGAQAFATQLLAGGGAAVAEVNAMQARIGTASKALGASAATNLYQAGVDAAQGMVNGLESQMTAVAQKMTVLAKIIVKAIRKALKIKSPSKVMEQIGKQTAQGLAGGLTKSQGIVGGAAESVASSAIDTMRETMANLSDILATDLDSTPVISPVVDLSEVQRQSEIMQGIFDGITPLSSYGQASAIANEQQATADAVAAAGASTPQMVFEQNNYSPTALTPIEIYRQTRNQLAAARLATR